LPLKGQTFVVTGTLSSLSREPGPGADRSRRKKRSTAEALGVAVIDEQTLRAMLLGSCPSLSPATL